MLEGWKQGVRNTWWIVDYNRQSLDAVIREGLYARFEALFRAFGWDVVDAQIRRAAAGGLRASPAASGCATGSTRCPNQLYSALTFQGGAAWRKRLLDDLGDQGPVQRG